MAVRMSSLGNGLVIAGGVVGAATVAAIATGTEIVLTPGMIQIVIYKGLAAAAVGLIIVGSLLGRRGRQHDQAVSVAPSAPTELEEGRPPFHQSSGKQADATDTVRSSQSR